MSAQLPADGARPLDGVRVLELGTTIAGPFCGRLLCDFGAEVVKIEPPEGDPIRGAGKLFQGKSLYAASILRGKRLVAADLRHPQAQALVRALVPKFDVVIENFRPGALEKWGLGYADLVKLNPGLVMVRISGYGQSGPYSARPGYGIVCEAVGGLRYIIGDPDRPPARANIGLTDYITGLYAAFGAMMALRHKEHTGQGQYVDTALYECAFSFMEPHVPAYEKLGVIAERMGAGLADSHVNNMFATRDGVYVHVQGAQSNSFRRLCEAMGRPELAADARFAERRTRNAHGAEIDTIVAAWVGERDYAELERAFTPHGVTFTRVYSMADIFDDPHFAARGMLAEAKDDRLGAVTVAAPVPRLSATPGRVDRAGGEIGESTRAVLRQYLDLDDAAIARLQAAGAIACAPQGSSAPA
ncbi:MAG: CoA transferase [Burkholderiales bacterium]|nr:CoA transferase [Burkholderiales bacterium]